MRGIYPANGPEGGGTVVDITLAGLAAANGVVPPLTCRFPGGVIATGTWLSPILAQCTSPPLASLTSGTTKVATWSWAPVALELPGRVAGHFLFAYTRGVGVERLEPSDTIVVAATPLTDLAVLVWGTGFIPARDGGL